MKEAMPLNKVCILCRQDLTFDCFHFNRTKKDGLHNRCKICQSKVSLEWAKNNRAKYNERQRKSKTLHLENGLCKHCKRPNLTTSNVCEDHYISNVSRCRLGSGNKEAAKKLKDKLITQNYLCPYTGEKLVVGVNAHIDHIMPACRFPELSGDLSNVEWVSDKANLAKRDMTKEEFLSFCQRVVDFNNSRESDASKVTPTRYETH